MTSLLILFLTAIAVLFAGLLPQKNRLQPIAFAGVAIALFAAVRDWYFQEGWLNAQFPTMIHFDRFALAFSAVLCALLLLLIRMAGWGFRTLGKSLGDYYGLLLFSSCGALCMVSFQNIVMLFLGIEILSIPLYVLAGSRHNDLKSNEAALKYFLMGAFATGIFLFGAALLFGATASFDLGKIATTLAMETPDGSMTKFGILLIIIGLSFKVAAAPFHFWAPDVYTGSPTMITAFMSTVVKTAAIAAFFRLFSQAFAPSIAFWSAPIVMITGMTLVLANTAALFQQNFKRMMAYSSISHAGYLLLGILAIENTGTSGAILLYTLTYSIATICAFAVFMLVAEQNHDEHFTAFSGLSKSQPFMSAIMAVSMFSLAGIPPLAGFFGKYFLFVAAFKEYAGLVVLAIINSAVSIYYYFKVFRAMYFETDAPASAVKVPPGMYLLLMTGFVLMLVLMIFPGSVYQAI